MGIEEFYVTFGVQYTNDPTNGVEHPLGMHKDGYAVIEAPNYAVAQQIANAIFDQAYAFLYDKSEFIDDGKVGRWYLDEHGRPRELLRIAWRWPERGDPNE